MNLVVQGQTPLEGNVLDNEAFFVAGGCQKISDVLFRKKETKNRKRTKKSKKRVVTSPVPPP